MRCTLSMRVVGSWILSQRYTLKQVNHDRDSILHALINGTYWKPLFPYIC
jgi:hypothetical protein